MSLVIGGTGTVGGQVVRELLARGEQVRVLTRSTARIAVLPSGADGVVGDLTEPESLDRAFDGIETLFLATPLSPTETDEGLTAVAAAQAAGVRRIVYMTVHRLLDGWHIPHFRSKFPVIEAIRRSGLEFTLLEPNNFYQNDLSMAEAIVKAGVYPQPLGSIGLHRVDVRDIAEAAVNALLQPGHAGEIYPLAGPDRLTGPGTAEIYGRLLGREVRYGGDDLDAWAAQVKALMPDWMVADLVEMYGHFQDSGLLASDREIERTAAILGHPPRSFESFVVQVFVPATSGNAGSPAA